MRIIETIAGLEKIREGCVLAIGNFDGVHPGHKRILERTKSIASEKGSEFVVMTFEPHPAAVLHPEKAPGVLTPLKLKEHLLGEFGADWLIVLKDSFELLNLSPKEFVDEFLVKVVRPDTVVEGGDFNFGYGRSGDIRSLQQLGIERGFRVLAVGPERVELSSGEIVRISSTLIRHLLDKGNVPDAARALGRPYRLIGRTVAGRGIGKRLGFPTANIHPVEQIIPAEGVYAGFVEVGGSFDEVCVTGRRRAAAFSIGRAKTFITERPLLVEAHILEEDVEDLAGKYLAMDFVGRIRGQMRFETEKELAEQIGKDCEKAKEILCAEDKWQKSEDRRQRTEDRRQRTEDKER